MPRLTSTAIPLLALLAFACAPELDLEPAPDIDTRLDEFYNPTAVVVPEIMAAVAAGISETRDEVERASFYEEILEVIVEVQDELYNDQGQVDLGDGVTFDSPNGGVTVEYICDGWDEPPPVEPDPANGSMFLNMRLAQGSIAPLVWGGVEACRYPVQLGGLRLDALYQGEIALLFSEPLTSENDPYALEVIFFTDGSVEVDGRSFPIDKTFSVTLLEDNGGYRLDRLEILVLLPDGTSFVYGFLADLGQEITDSTGTFRCSLEEQFCESPSGTFSW